MKPVDFIDAIGWAVNCGFIEYPQNYGELVNRTSISQNEWQSVNWIAGEAKPSWNDVLDWYLSCRINRLINPQEGAWEKSNLKRERADLIKRLNRESTGLHIGTMDRLVNLQALATASLPVEVELRKVEGGVEIIKSKKRLKEVLAVAIGNENKVNNAHNRIKSRYEGCFAVANDSQADTHERLRAAEKAGNINRNYKQLLEAELNK